MKCPKCGTRTNSVSTTNHGGNVPLHNRQYYKKCDTIFKIELKGDE